MRDPDELERAVLAELQKIGPGDPAAFLARRGARMENTRCVEVRDGIAIIPIIGPIVPRADFFTEISGATAIDSLMADFATAMDDPNISHVVLNIDSPGGTVNGTGEFARYVYERGKQKPVIGYTPNMALSGGYWIFVACREKWMSETASVGSVGAIVRLYSPGKIAGEYEFISTQSPNKRLDPESDEGKRRAQQWIDDVAAVFISRVAEYCGVAEEKVLSDFGKGDVMIAGRAIPAGMADRVGTLESLLTDLHTRRTAVPAQKPVLPPSPAARTSTRPAGSSSARANGGYMENCSNSNCGHPRDQHPSDGACSAQDCTCTAYAAPAADAKALAASLGEANARNAHLAARLDSEALSRISAEVRAFRVPLLTKDDLRFNVQSVDAHCNMLLVAKCAAAGLTVAKVKEGDKEREIRLDAATIGAFFAEQIEAVTQIGARFTPPTGEMPPPKQLAAHGVTLADFAKASHDAEAGRRIAAASRRARKKRAARNSRAPICIAQLGGT